MYWLYFIPCGIGGRIALLVFQLAVTIVIVGLKGSEKQIMLVPIKASKDWYGNVRDTSLLVFPRTYIFMPWSLI